MTGGEGGVRGGKGRGEGGRQKQSSLVPRPQTHTCQKRGLVTIRHAT